MSRYALNRATKSQSTMLSFTEKLLTSYELSFCLPTFPRKPKTRLGLTTVGRLPTPTIYKPAISRFCQIATDRKAGNFAHHPRSVCATCLIQCRGRYRLDDLAESRVLPRDPETAGGQNSALGVLPNSWWGRRWGSDHQGIETKVKGWVWSCIPRPH